MSGPSAWRGEGGDYVEAALIPNSAAEWGYLTAELAGEPNRWRRLLSWEPQLDRWLTAAPHSRMSIDHLVIAIRELDVVDQVEKGLRWIESIVAGAGETCASTYTLPEWLRERRPDLVSPDHILGGSESSTCSSWQATHGSQILSISAPTSPSTLPQEDPLPRWRW